MEVECASDRLKMKDGTCEYCPDGSLPSEN